MVERCWAAKREGFRATRLTVGASNDLQMERNLTRGLSVLYQGHSANTDPFREGFSPAREKKTEGCNGCGESVGSRNGQRGKGPYASFKKQDDAMQMMTWQKSSSHSHTQCKLIAMHANDIGALQLALSNKRMMTQHKSK